MNLLPKLLITCISYILVLLSQILIFLNCCIDSTMNFLGFVFWVSFIPSLTVLLVLLGIIVLSDNLRKHWNYFQESKLLYERINIVYLKQSPMVEFLRLFQLYVISMSVLFLIILIPVAIYYNDDPDRFGNYLNINLCAFLPIHIIFVYIIIKFFSDPDSKKQHRKIEK